MADADDLKAFDAHNAVNCDPEMFKRIYTKMEAEIVNELPAKDVEQILAAQVIVPANKGDIRHWIQLVIKVEEAKQRRRATWWPKVLKSLYGPRFQLWSLHLTRPIVRSFLLVSTCTINWIFT